VCIAQVALGLRCRNCVASAQIVRCLAREKNTGWMFHGWSAIQSTYNGSSCSLKACIAHKEAAIFRDRNARDYDRPPGIQITGKSLDTRPQRVKRITHLSRFHWKMNAKHKINSYLYREVSLRDLVRSFGHNSVRKIIVFQKDCLVSSINI